ncbi:MAG: MAPEG family protein [Gammaproteobacteria bacterium]
MAAEIPSTLMFWPMAAMALLTAVAWVTMGRRRFAAVRSREVALDDFRGDRQTPLPAPAAIATRHFANHFEIPVLFYVVCLLYLVFGAGDTLAAILAWAFVLVRAGHAREHLGRNQVATRFRLYVASTCMVWALWLLLAFRLALR